MRPIDNDPPKSQDHRIEELSPYASFGGKHAPPVENDDIRVLVRILQPGSAARLARTVVRETLRQAGLDDDAIADAEVIVAELAANAEKHASQPYELRIFSVDGIPTWCEVVDGDPEIHELHAVLKRLNTPEGSSLDLLALADGDLFTENGRGLLMAYQLSHGRCRVYPTTALATKTPGKAIAFALPIRSGSHLIFTPISGLGS